LRGSDGWLTLCGLAWLEEGENVIGSSEDNAYPLPAGKCPSVACTLTLKDGVVTLSPTPNAGVIRVSSGEEKDIAVDQPLRLVHDGEGSPTKVFLPPDGVISFFIIQRDGKLGARCKDRTSPTLLEFKGIERFPVSLDWRKRAIYSPHADGTKIIPCVSALGLNDPQKSPGFVTFTHDGADHTLDVIEEDGEDDFWFMFKDQTNGKETYGFRYMYAPKPQQGSSEMFVDFNKAYTPPCGFTPYATCAMPPKSNHLPFRVEAGEKKYDDSDH